MPEQWLNFMVGPLVTFWGGILMKLPNLIGALILLFAGSLLARFIRQITEKILLSSRIDDFLAKVGFSEILSRVGLGRRRLPIMLM